MNSKFLFHDGAFSLTNSNGFGWVKFLFEFNGALSTSVPWKTEDSEGSLKATAQFPDHAETLSFKHDPEQHSLTVSRTITNTGKFPLCFKSVSDGLLSDESLLLVSDEGSGGFNQKSGKFNHYAEANNLRWFHSGNLRQEHMPKSLRLDYPYVRKLPIEPLRFNQTEANDVPAFGICDKNYRGTAVEGDLKQTQFARSWELAVTIPGRRLTSPVHGVCRGIMSYPASNGFELAAGASIEVSKVFYQILEDTHPQDAFAGYVEALGHEFRPYGSVSPLLHEAIYCTWNFGVFGDITEANILERARILRDKVPECRYFMIDDGFQANGNGLDSFYPDPSKNYNPERFPHGMKYVADELRKLGLVPCLWFCPTVKRDSALAREHHEWLLRDVDGSTDAVFGGGYLDLGNPEARAFFLKVLDTLYVDWGYKGIKFDFSSHWYLKDDARFTQGSGLEWREFIFREIRKRVGDDGVFMTCLAAGMGNPIQGRHADSYRCSWDINTCTWPEIDYNAEATLPQILQEGRKTLLLNMDSVGFGDKITEAEQFFRFNWVFITQGLFELGGKMENLTDKQFATLRKLFANIDRGHRVHYADEQAFRGDPLPECVQVSYPEGSRIRASGVKRHVAFFNWFDTKKVVGLEVAEDDIKDFWTGAPVVKRDGMLTVTLPPHSSAMYAVK